MAETLNHLEGMEWKPTPLPVKPKLETGHDCGIKTTSVMNSVHPLDIKLCVL